MELKSAFSEIGTSIWSAVGGFLRPFLTLCARFWFSLPDALRIVLLIAFYFALINFFLSLGKAIKTNFHEWEDAPDSKLKLSYFCGTGNYRRRLIFPYAMILLRDKKWSWLSAAGLAYRIGECSNKSSIILFIGTLLYIPFFVVGFFEMILRVVVGTAVMFLLNGVWFCLLFVLGLLTLLLIPVFRLIDYSQRAEQHCTRCYTKFRLPKFKCPYCGEVHDDLAPGKYGLFYSMCSCGRFIPCSVLSKRGRLTAVCPNPKCEMDLDSANAKQFFIQIIGGNSSGKTAFVAAFQHLYMKHGQSDEWSISGEPKDVFADLEMMYSNGNARSSSTSQVGIYNFVHRTKKANEPSLIFYEVPDEVLLSEEYEKSPLNFGYCDGIFILIDPLSIPSVRSECQRANCLGANDVYSQDSPDSIVIHFINKFSEIVGRSAQRMSDVPVAVLITKSDVKSVANHIGMAKIKSEYGKSPETYGSKLENAKNAVCSQYLMDIGLANVVNNLDSVFTRVSYFPVSAIGHTATTGKPFKPLGVIEPVEWIARKQQAAFSSVLKDVQSSISVGDA